VAEAQRLSKAYRQGAKGARIPAALLFWVVGLALTAQAQEPTYSANSLMATFDNGRINLKGAEIFFRDVVAESRTSRVIFKSSQSDRVICELVPSVQHGNVAAVGSVLAVRGRVRGRGLLGNVTLDDCSIAPVEEAAATPVTADTVPEEAASAQPEVISEAAAILPPASVPDRPAPIAKQFATPSSAPRAAAIPSPVEQAPIVPTARDHSENSIPLSPESQSHVPYGWYVLIFLSGAAASLILSKLITPATRVSRPADPENTPQVRQAALQALLLKAEKKK
jgi:hypothetical protein